MEIINSDVGGPRHAVNTPHDIKQMFNCVNFALCYYCEICIIRLEISRILLVGNIECHMMLCTIMHELHSQLIQEHNGVSKSFLSHMLSIPRIVVHLIPHLLLHSLETLLKVSSPPVTLHYDTVFNIGDFYLSTVSFQNCLFEKEPIIPCGFLLHSRRLQQDHRDFIQMLTKELPLLITKRLNIVTDQEFKFSDLFPCGTHLYCWNHIRKDLQWHLKSRCNCTADEIYYFVNLLL